MATYCSWIMIWGIIFCQMFIGLRCDEKAIVQELETMGDESDIKVESGWRTAMPYESLKWNKGVVPYKIDGFSGKFASVIKSAMKEIEEKTKIGSTPCIKFVERKNEEDYLNIKKGDRCNSNLGKVGGAQETLLADKCAERKGIVMHELMHVLGFYHEQNRPDRNQYVTIHEKNIKAGRAMWNFRELPEEDVTTLGLPYDYGSILHYGEKYYSKNDQPTITPNKKGVEIGQRDHLSDNDVKKMQKHYECKAPVNFKCNFDKDFCGITQPDYLMGEWERSNKHRSDDPKLYNSGPDGDHTTGKGYYAVIRGRSRAFANPRLEVIQVPPSDVGYCVRFWYQMSGTGNTINGNGQVVIESMDDGQRFPMWQRDGKDAWHNYILHFKPVTHSLVVLTGVTTKSELEKNDIAIDDLTIVEAPDCNSPNKSG